MRRLNLAIKALDIKEELLLDGDSTSATLRPVFCPLRTGDRKGGGGHRSDTRTPLFLFGRAARVCWRAFAAKERRKFANLEETEEAAAGKVGAEARSWREKIGRRRLSSRFIIQVTDSRFRGEEGEYG